ncbi:DUF3596 domain-containing protein, partial [Citrobacter freundii]
MDFPTGVELHNGKIRITFTYRGKRCREVLRGWTVNSSNIKKAGNLRALITSDLRSVRCWWRLHWLQFHENR